MLSPECPKCGDVMKSHRMVYYTTVLGETTAGLMPAFWCPTHNIYIPKCDPEAKPIYPKYVAPIYEPPCVISKIYINREPFIF